METIQDFTNFLIDELRHCGRHETAKSYRSSVRSLLGFVQNPGLRFSDLTPDLFHGYNQHLLVTLDRSRNSAALYLRLLSSLCGKASKGHLAELPDNLFEGIFTGKGAPRRCALSMNVLARLILLNFLDGQQHLAFARDLFLLSFYLRGIPFVDLAHLRKSDVHNGVIYYCRKKTQQPVAVHIPDVAQEIIDRYTSATDDGTYLLPIIKKPGAANEKVQYDSALRLYNKRLTAISDLLGVEESLTSYVARHTWATIAHDNGVSIAYISQALGHSSEEVTRDYLRSFDDEALSEVNEYVIGLVQEQVNGLDNSRKRPVAKRQEPIVKEESEAREKVLKFLRLKVPVI